MKTTCWHGITKVGPSNDWQNKTKPDFAPQLSGSISLQIRHEPKQRLMLKHMITALEPQLQCAFKCASQLCLQCNMHKPQLFKCYWQLQVLRWSTFLIKNIPALVFITFIVIVAKLPLLNIYILSYFSSYFPVLLQMYNILATTLRMKVISKICGCFFVVMRSECWLDYPDYNTHK